MTPVLGTNPGDSPEPTAGASVATGARLLVAPRCLEAAPKSLGAAPKRLEAAPKRLGAASKHAQAFAASSPAVSTRTDDPSTRMSTLKEGDAKRSTRHHGIGSPCLGESPHPPMPPQGAAESPKASDAASTR
jgi:hypothetical protein